MVGCAQVVFGLALPSNSRFCSLIGCAIATRVMSPRGRKTLRQLGAKRSMSIAPSRAAEACALVERPRKRKRGSRSTEAFLADDMDPKYSFVPGIGEEDTDSQVQRRVCLGTKMPSACYRNGSRKSPSWICRPCRNSEETLRRVARAQGDEAAFVCYRS
jgi:hypothetical protein